MMSVGAEAGQNAGPAWLKSRAIFLIGLCIAGSGLISPPVALVAGVIFALLLEHPLRAQSAKLAKVLLQASVVLLGFGMNLAQVVRAGRDGFLYTAVGLALALMLGAAIGRLLRISGNASFLISAGTAICGGSAIAALAPVTQAGEEEISVSMGTVFLLNSLGLIAFPLIGRALRLTQEQFGLWIALAIHDTSSVVGAGAAYGAQALAVGTTVKLARALWIVPLTLAVAAWKQAGAKKKSPDSGKAKVAKPWFILLFCCAAAIATYLPRGHRMYGTLTVIGHTGLTATLFLIGTGLSKKTLARVGWRPLLQGVLLWGIVATTSLYAIYAGWIGI